MITVRIQFEKCGEAAYISLLDLQRVFQRLLQRSRLPVYYTQGYNPHIYLAFACPLSLGQESLCESCEVKTEVEDADFSQWKEVLQPWMPRGITIRSVAPAVAKMGEIDHAVYRVTLPCSAAGALDAYNTTQEALVSKKSKRAVKTLDLKAYVPQIDYQVQGETAVFTLTLPCGSGEALNLNPSLWLNYLQQSHNIPPWQCQVLRTRVCTKSGEDFC